MSEEAVEAAPVVETPAVEAAPAVEGGKMVAIKDETVEFTAGILGGVAGLAVGGPVLGAIGAAVLNYASKNEAEVGEVVKNVSKTAIEIYNYLVKLDTKYEVLKKSQESLKTTLDKAKSSGGSSDTIDQLENALSTTSKKITEVNDEYDLVGTGVTALGVIGDLVEKAVKKAGELNDEYKLTDKAMDSLNTAVSKAKSS